MIVKFKVVFGSNFAHNNFVDDKRTNGTQGDGRKFEVFPLDLQKRDVLFKGFAVCKGCGDR